MKTKIISLILFVVICLSFSACTENKSVDALWKDAIYTEDTTLGNGKKTFTLEVKTDNKSVVFTINTDKDNLEDSLTEHKLIEGDKGQFGLYIKKVNGITADYDINQSYWSLCTDGNPLQTGAQGAKIKGGENYQFVYTRN